MDLLSKYISVTREVKLIFLSFVDATSDRKLQELGMHLHLREDFLQFQGHDYFILYVMTARKQLSSFPTAKSLYVKAKNQLLNKVKSTCEDYLQVHAFCFA